MKTKTLIISSIIILVILAVVVYLYKQANSNSSSSSKQDYQQLESLPTEPSTSDEQETTGSISKPQDPKDQERKTYKKEFSASPDPKTYKPQITEAPVLPPELRPFVKQMAKAMEDADSNPQTRLEVFNKLTRCAHATSDQEILTVRAACAENMKTLARKYPDELQSFYDSESKTFDPEVKRLLF